MFNPIEAKRRFVEAQIKKSFDNGINLAEETDLEKAWNIGDEKQYQGVTWYVGGFNAKGQPLWRKKKDGGGNNKAASTNSSAKQSYSKEKSASSNSTSTAGAKTTKKRYNLNPDGTPMDMSKIGDDNLRFSISLVKTNIKDLKNKLGQTSNGAVVTRKNLNAQIEDQEGKLAEMEEEMNKRVNSKSTTKNQTSTSELSNDSVWDDSAGGYKTEPFKGAAKVDSLKVGDKLKTRSGKIYTVKSVTDNANNTVDIVMDNGSKIGGGVFAQTYNKSSYIGATKVDDKSKQSNLGYSDLTFDEAVKIGESHISAEEESSIEKEPLRYLQEDAKHHKWDDDVKYQEGELKRAVNMKIGSSNFMAPSKVVTSEYKSKEIKRYADALATAEERKKLYKKALAKAKADKKHFLNNTGDDFTENEVITYINNFRPKDEPNAVVENRWYTLSGRIGNTSATISVGSGKAKDINDGTPDWRPIGVYSYSTMGWDGKMMTITGTVQSWKEVKDCLSDTENMRISIYKHPKQ